VRDTQNAAGVKMFRRLRGSEDGCYQTLRKKLTGKRRGERRKKKTVTNVE